VFFPSSFAKERSVFPPSSFAREGSVFFPYSFARDGGVLAHKLPVPNDPTLLYHTCKRVGTVESVGSGVGCRRCWRSGRSTRLVAAGAGEGVRPPH
jgi:hypothetical protein